MQSNKSTSNVVDMTIEKFDTSSIPIEKSSILQEISDELKLISNEKNNQMLDKNQIHQNLDRH